jgi:hypothetical protein
MTKMSSLYDMCEIEQNRAGNGRFASKPHPVAADPVMLEKIGKGLHELYGSVPNSALPIYFGPVLGELYLTPLPRRRSA